MTQRKEIKHFSTCVYRRDYADLKKKQSSLYTSKNIGNIHTNKKVAKLLFKLAYQISEQWAQ